MKFDGLEESYWDEQRSRIARLVAKIRDGDSLQIGRVVPGDEDLVIGEGRRLRVSVLFLDITGFSSLPAETHEEQDLLRRALSLFFSEMVRIAEDYGGTVEKNTGDGLMAYFRDEPTRRGAEKAVAASLTMHAANHHLLAPYFVASGLTPFAFRIGIDSGHVSISLLGAARRFNAVAAIGTTANIACKLLALGGPGDVLIGDSARADLPSTWWTWTQPLGTPSGWVYRITGLNYPAWRFTGRWTRLI